MKISSTVVKVIMANLAFFMLQTAVFAQSINVISPNGGESWKFGSSQTINWSSSGIAADTSISIAFVDQFGVNWSIGASLNDGSEQIILPSSIYNGAHKVRLIANTSPPVSDESDAVFTIFNSTDSTPPSLAVTNVSLIPIFNTTTVNITATASDESGIQKIEIFTDEVLRLTCNNTAACTYRSRFSKGAHTFHAFAYDSARNVVRNPASGAKSLAVEMGDPVFAITFPTPGTNLYYNTPYNFTWTTNTSMDERIWFSSSSKYIGFKNNTGFMEMTFDYGSVSGFHYLSLLHYSLPGTPIQYGFSYTAATSNFTLVPNETNKPELSITYFNYTKLSNYAIEITAVASATDDSGLGRIDVNIFSPQSAIYRVCNPGNATAYTCTVKINETQIPSRISAKATATDIYSNSFMNPYDKYGFYVYEINVTDPPSVSVGHSLASPGTSDTVNISATLNYFDDFIDNTTIFVDGVQETVCYDKTLLCSITRTFSPGAHTYYAVTYDNWDNSARDPASGTKGFTIASPSAGGGTGGSSGISGGGAAAPQRTITVTEDTAIITPQTIGSTAQTFNVPSDFIISSVTMQSSSSASGVSVAIKKINSANIPQPPGTLYNYVRIDATNTRNVNYIEVTFDVERQWLDSNGFAPGEVRMLRYVYDWEEMPTFPISENATHHRFRSVLPGFSVFAVVGNRIDGTLPETTSGTGRDSEEPLAPLVSSKSDYFTLPVQFFIISGVFFAVAALLYVYYHHKRLRMAAASYEPRYAGQRQQPSDTKMPAYFGGTDAGEDMKRHIERIREELKKMKNGKEEK